VVVLRKSVKETLGKRAACRVASYLVDLLDGWAVVVTTSTACWAACAWETAGSSAWHASWHTAWSAAVGTVELHHLIEMLD
jgi:hypothetical protein